MAGFCPLWDGSVLPKIATNAPRPALDELLTLTKYCQKHLAPASVQGKELWIINKGKHIRKASEVLFPAEFKPSADWEKHQCYVPGMDFLSGDYVSGCTDSDLRAWRDFLHATGVKFDPDNGVEVFAMKFVEDKLAVRFANIVPVDALNHGYDMEADESNGKKVHLEVKGLTTEGNVELTGNEAKAAKIHAQSFYLCVVSGIPATPVLHLVRDPDRVGEKDKLTIKAAEWKRGRLE